MPKYPEMYALLFRSITQAIEILQTAQQQTEELYITSPPTNVHLSEIAKDEPQADRAEAPLEMHTEDPLT